jgi:hypothetical protein
MPNAETPFDSTPHAEAAVARLKEARDTLLREIEKIIVGYPLLGTEDDMKKVTDAVIENIPKERKKDEAVIFMGHGTAHPSNAFYTALLYHLQQKDPNIFIPTVDGSPTIEDVRATLTTKGIKKAYLMPLMTVAGDHARNDMSGDKDDSWKNILTRSVRHAPLAKNPAAGFVEYLFHQLLKRKVAMSRGYHGLEGFVEQRAAFTERGAFHGQPALQFRMDLQGFRDQPRGCVHGPDVEAVCQQEGRIPAGAAPYLQHHGFFLREMA